MKGKFIIFVSSLITLFGISFNCLADVEAGGQAGHSPFGSGLFLIVIIAIMYFLMIRPQSKRRKEHSEMIKKIAEGDEVLTSGGIVGKITKVSGNFIVLSVNEGTTLTFQKGAIAQALPKGTLKDL